MKMNNKFKASRWMPVLFVLYVLFFAGCSGEDDGIGNETSENIIAFDCSTSNLRAAKTIAGDIQYFRVSAIWNKGNGVYTSFMDKQLVEKQDNNWVYSPIKHWPGYGSVSFFAHSPATSSGMESLYIDNAANQISIRYGVSTNYQHQEDFMVATSLNGTENPIKLKFEHALSSVSFQARSNEVGVTFRIKEIKLVNLYSKGIITGIADGTTSTWIWYESSVLTDYIVYQKYPFETQEDIYQEVGNLMVLPQKPDNNFKIIVTYDIVTAGISKSKEYTLDNDFTFDMSKKYTFYLNLTQSSSRTAKQSITTPELELRYNITDSVVD